jgi:hypothetical protein
MSSSRGLNGEDALAAHGTSHHYRNVRFSAALKAEADIPSAMAKRLYALRRPVPLGPGVLAKRLHEGASVKRLTDAPIIEWRGPRQRAVCY